MEGDSLRSLERRYADGWVILVTLGLLAACVLACIYLLAGFPAQAQVTGPTEEYPSTSVVAPAAPVRRAAPFTVAAAPAQLAVPLTESRADAALNTLQTELDQVRSQLQQSEENLRQATHLQAQIRSTSAVFLAVFAMIAALITLQAYRHSKNLERNALRAIGEVQAVSSQLEAMRDSQKNTWKALPALLQEVGEQPLFFEEEGNSFAPRSLTIIDDLDHLAYIGAGRQAFRDPGSQSDAAVYLNGLLLSAAAHLSRKDCWTAFARLEQFFQQLSRFPDVVDRRRIAQGHSYRALACYQILEAQDQEPSWLRKADRAQTESISKQAFSDVARGHTIDPEWRHTTFVEAMLCSRFYLSEEGADNASRNELYVRGLRRAVTLYKHLIDERAYRGPSRRGLIRTLKLIAEQTGEKSDFSDFGFALNSFPADEELADEALAARQPGTQDRFLWQWMLGDEELFATVERLNQAEYRAFWIRTLDNKVHLRNWRADLEELQQARPAMKEWSIQLLQVEPDIPLSDAISRRQERFDAPASGT